MLSLDYKDTGIFTTSEFWVGSSLHHNMNYMDISLETPFLLVKPEFFCDSCDPHCEGFYWEDSSTFKKITKPSAEE